MINVLDHGVIPDGKALNTLALQKLIDDAASTGGGTLHFPAGTYLTGGLTLRSCITLNLDNGATLLGSPDPSHYTLHDPAPEQFHEGIHGVRALLFAVDAQQIRVTGQGTIDGQGGLFNRYTKERTTRPRIIWFARCRDIVVRDLKLRNSGFWMQHYMKCVDLQLLELDIWNHEGSNNDGMDIDCCRDVLIRGCRIDSADDAICLKSGNDQPTENVLVSQCQTRTHCNHFKTGTESNGGFRNIRVDGLIMTPSKKRESHPGTEGADWRGATGIALGSVDGGCLENITVQNVTMDQVRVPFFIRLGDRGRPISPSSQMQPVSIARNITIRNIIARGSSNRPSYIAGLPDAPVRDVTIADCQIEVEGGGDAGLLSRDVPLNRAGYPSMETFGDLPAHGIWARDVHGLALSNLRFDCMNPEPRPAIWWSHCADVSLDQVTSR